MDRSQFEIVLIDTCTAPDEVTAEFRAMADDWVSAANLHGDAFCDELRSRNLDIVCDLSGHTQGNRLTELAARCAPVQATLIGAMQTTGLSEMDIRFTDHWTDPIGTTETLHTEQLVRLNAGGWIFEPPPDMPDVQPLPAFKNGFITFGSFNNTAKITPCVLDSWSEILGQVPKSRLLLNGFHFRTIRDELVKRGVDEDRLEFIGRPAGQAYYAQHHRVDIALDTFPFNGLTVTCFAAWMGVPTLSHAEIRPASRVGYAIASRLGIVEAMIAPSKADLATQAMKLADDLEALSDIRASLRRRAKEGLVAHQPWVDEISQSIIASCTR